jgi:hypothetical protein
LSAYVLTGKLLFQLKVLPVKLVELVARRETPLLNPSLPLGWVKLPQILMSAFFS